MPCDSRCARRKLAVHLRRRLEPERRERLGEGAGVECRLHLQAVKRHREPRRGIGQPAEAAIDVRAGTTQGAVFELQIDRIELPDGPADLLHLAIGEFAHPRVRVAHQILVQIEDGDIEDIVQLAPQRGGIRGDAAKLAAGRDDRQRFLARRGTRDRDEARSARNATAGAECERRHLRAPRSRLRHASRHDRCSRTDCAAKPPIPQSANAISATVPSVRQRRG